MLHRASYRKHKRRATKPRNMQKFGNYHGGKIFYPTSIRSDKTPWNDYLIHKFRIETHFHSILTKRKTPLNVSFWHFTHADTLVEYLGFTSYEVPIFAKKSEYQIWEDKIFLSTAESYKTSQPRRIIVPHRKTLDNYGLNICIFQKDNYLGIPLCVSSLDKKIISVGWFYFYNTVIDNMEGLYFEVDHVIPLNLRGNVHYY